MKHCDSVDNECMDIGDGSGTYKGQGLIVCCLDGWKRTVDESLDGQRLDRVDLIQGHGLALGQDIEKVSKHDVEVDKLVRIWDDG